MMNNQLPSVKLDPQYRRSLHLYNLREAKLIGSYKQNEWAETIRGEFYNSAVEFKNSCHCRDENGDYMSWVRQLGIDRGYTDDELKWWGLYFEEAFNHLILYIQDMIIRHYKASWWIENKDNLFPQVWAWYQNILNDPNLSCCRLRHWHMCAMEKNCKRCLWLYN